MLAQGGAQSTQGHTRPMQSIGRITAGRRGVGVVRRDLEGGMPGRAGHDQLVEPVQRDNPGPFVCRPG